MEAMMQCATNIWLTKLTCANHEYEATVPFPALPSIYNVYMLKHPKSKNKYYFKLSIFYVVSRLKNKITAHIFVLFFGKNSVQM
jgi:hypothetical protein